jgi:hypothetical protein
MALMIEGRADKGIEPELPLSATGYVIQIAQETTLGPIMQFDSLEVSRLWGGVVQGPTAQHHHGRVAPSTDNGGIDPAMAERLPVLTHDIGGSGFASGRPPVKNLYFASQCGLTEQSNEKCRDEAHA